MRQIWQRILAALTVLFCKRVIVIDAVLQKEKNRVKVAFWTTIENKDDQITYLDQMHKNLLYERQEELEKRRNFIEQNN